MAQEILGYIKLQALAGAATKLTVGTGVRIRLALFLAMSALAACASPAPRLGRGLPSNFADANRAFDERVRARFPVGSQEVLLREALKVDHFKISAETPPPSSSYQFSANRGGEIFPACELDWTIFWSADGGRIAKIGASYYATCL